MKFIYRLVQTFWIWEQQILYLGRSTPVWYMGLFTIQCMCDGGNTTCLPYNENNFVFCSWSRMLWYGIPMWQWVVRRWMEDVWPSRWLRGQQRRSKKLWYVHSFVNLKECWMRCSDKFHLRLTVYPFRVVMSNGKATETIVHLLSFIFYTSLGLKTVIFDLITMC